MHVAYTVTSIHDKYTEIVTEVKLIEAQHTHDQHNITVHIAKYQTEVVIAKKINKAHDFIVFSMYATYYKDF